MIKINEKWHWKNVNKTKQSEKKSLLLLMPLYVVGSGTSTPTAQMSGSSLKKSSLPENDMVRNIINSFVVFYQTLKRDRVKCR